MTDINKQIIKKIRSIIEYKYANIAVKDLKRYFRSNTNLKKLANDIRYIGIEQFEDKQDYLDNLKSVFDIIVEDKEAVLKDVYESKNNIKKFGEFLKMKMFENFEGFKELTYIGGFDENEDECNDEIFIDVLSDGTITDIYTYKDKNFILYDYENERKTPIKWVEGKNPLFVHCDKKYYKRLLKHLFNEFNLVGLDEEDEDEYILLHDLEVRMKKKYR